MILILGGIERKIQKVMKFHLKDIFKISKFGPRGTPKFKKSKISVLVDSFAFCRYINDNQTWQSF